MAHLAAKSTEAATNHDRQGVVPLLRTTTGKERATDTHASSTPRSTRRSWSPAARAETHPPKARSAWRPEANAQPLRATPHSRSGSNAAQTQGLRTRSRGVRPSLRQSPARAPASTSALSTPHATPSGWRLSGSVISVFAAEFLLHFTDAGNMARHPLHLLIVISRPRRRIRRL